MTTENGIPRVREIEGWSHSRARSGPYCDEPVDLDESTQGRLPMMALPSRFKGGFLTLAQYSLA